MKTHQLKVWPEFFGPLSTGEKTFEVRKDDRGFRVGDVLELREFSVLDGFSEKEPLRRIVTYLLAGPAFGIERGFCVMGLKEAE